MVVVIQDILKNLTLTIFLLVLFTNSLFGAPVEFELSSSEVAKGEPLIVSARVEGSRNAKPAGKVFTEGKVKAIYSGIMKETKIINFQTSTYTVLRFSIVESTPGKYKIPPIEVLVDGTPYQIPKTYFTVSNQSVQQSHPGIFGNFSRYLRDPVEDVDPGTISIRFQTNKSSIYLGEPIIGYFIAYSKSPKNPQFERNPNESISFPYFTSELLTGVQINYPKQVTLDKNGKAEKYFTEPYNREIFALIPLKEGKFKIGRTKFEIMNSFGFPLESSSLNVEPQEIEVKPLPKETPPSFSGEVGNFEVFVDYSGTEMSRGNPWRFQVVVKGEGLCNRVKDPILDRVPKNFPGTIVSMGVERDRKFTEMKPGEFGFHCSARFKYSVSLKESSKQFKVDVSFLDSNKEEYITKHIIVPSIRLIQPQNLKSEEEGEGNTVIGEDFSEENLPLISWGKLLAWTFFLALSGSGLFHYIKNVRPVQNARKSYFMEMDRLAGTKSGILLEKSLVKSISEDEARFLRGLRDKYTNKKFSEMYSLMDYKEKEELENWIKKGDYKNEYN